MQWSTGCATLPLGKKQIFSCPKIKILLLVCKLFCHFHGALQEGESLGETCTWRRLGSPGWEKQEY